MQIKTPRLRYVAKIPGFGELYSLAHENDILLCVD